MKCPICDDHSHDALYKINNYSISRCKTCTHIFVSDALALETLNNAYEQDYYQGKNYEVVSGYNDYIGNLDQRLAVFSERLTRIQSRTPKRGKILDYGCAVGLFVKVAKEAGWKAVGYERSEWASNYGKNTFGVDIVCGSGRAEDFPDNHFDTITMWDVLEHLEHPSEILGMVSRWMRSGGTLVLNTVNSSSLGAKIAASNWRHLLPPHHLQYFSRRSIEQLLANAGFNIISFESQGVMLGASTSYSHSSSNVLRRGIENAATHWRSRKVANLFNLLDEFEIVAVKR